MSKTDFLCTLAETAEALLLLACIVGMIAAPIALAYYVNAALIG